MENIYLYIKQNIGLSNWFKFHKIFFPTKFKIVSKTSLVFRHVCKDEKNSFNT